MKKIIFSLIILIGLYFLFKSYAFYTGIRERQGGEPVNIHVQISSQDSVHDIAAQLEEKGLIRKASLFRDYVKYRGFDRQIKAGNYDLNTHMNMMEMVNRFLLGPVKEEITITLVEGWTIQDIDDYFAQKNILEPGVFMQTVLESANDVSLFEIYPYLKELPKGVDLEGYIFPDTYRIYADATAKEILLKILSNFDKKIKSPAIQEGLQKSPYSLHEVMTIASILEKEVKTKEDKHLVADIIEKRLKIGMPLQMDSTVNYVTGRKRDRIYLIDRDIESPYNTYKYKGLPIGPIANPGMDSLYAALYPQTNTYYYFLTDPRGKAYYATTHEQHVANRKYMQ